MLLAIWAGVTFRFFTRERQSKPSDSGSITGWFFCLLLVGMAGSRRKSLNGPALLIAALFTVGASAIGAQEFAVEVEKPAFAAGSGPLVLWDAAHHNAHHWEMTAFHEVLRKDGFNLAFQTERWTPAALEAAAILVVPGPLAVQRESLWVKGANHYWWSDEGRQSAFTADEVAAAVSWVRRGGSLLLILDHAPSADAARLLAEALGVEVRNSMTWDDGREPPERVDRVATYVGSSLAGEGPTMTTSEILFDLNQTFSSH